MSNREKNYFKEKYSRIVNAYFKDFKYVDPKNILRIIDENIKLIFKNYNNVAIWGAGEHTDVLFSYFSAKIKNVNFIIEKNLTKAKRKYGGYNCIEPKEIKENKIDCIIISSFQYRKEIREEIQNIDKNIKYLDIYEEFQKSNIFIDTPFYVLSQQYEEINDNLLRFKGCLNEEEKISVLNDLIKSYLEINDFLNVFKSIEEYRNLDIPDSTFFDGLEKKLRNLLCELKTKLRNTNKENVLLLYIDALRYKDIYENKYMGYLNKMSSESICFENAFSTSIFTYESIISCFKGEMPLENKNYTRTFVNGYECEFIKKAQIKNYDINFYTLVCDNFVNDDKINYNFGGQYCAKTLWDCITNIACDENKSLSLLYFLLESHYPHMCGDYIENYVSDGSFQNKDEYQKQYVIAIKYLDKQLEFYLELLGKKNNIVIFSDHGQRLQHASTDVKELDTILGWHDDRYKIPLIVKGEKFKKQKIKKLFSLVDFNNLISGILDNKFKISYREEVEMQLSKIHNKKYRNELINNGKSDYANGFKVYRNKRYKVALIGDENKIRAFEIKKHKEEEVYSLKNIKKACNNLNVKFKRY